MNLVPKKHLLVNVSIQSMKYRKKILCVDNRVRETIGDVCYPTCRNEKCVYILTKKTTSFYDCKKCKACCNVLNVPFKDQKPTIMLFGGDGTNSFAKQTCCNYEKEKASPLWRNFSTNQNRAHPKIGQRKQKGFHFLHSRVDTPLVDSVNQKLLFSLILYIFSLH